MTHQLDVPYNEMGDNDTAIRPWRRCITLTCLGCIALNSSLIVLAGITWSSGDLSSSHGPLLAKLAPLQLSGSRRHALADEWCDFPNIEYLGVAYDMARGMPQPFIAQDQEKPFDQGWKMLNVFQVDPIPSTSSANRRCGPPEGVVVRHEEACDFSSTTSVIDDAFDYQQRLGHDFQGQAGIDAYGLKAGAFFTRSSEFKLVAHRAEDHRYTLTSAACVVYEAALLRKTGPNLTQEFKDWVAALPDHMETDADRYAYQDFIANWGTHYSSDVSMGARASRLLEFDKQALNLALSQGFDLHASAKVDFNVFTAKGSRHVSEESQFKDKFSHTEIASFEVCLGARGICPTGPDATAWHRAAFQHPMPIQATFSPIAVVLDPSFFPEDATIIHKRRNLIEHTNRIYCQGRLGCNVVPPQLDVSAAADLPGGTSPAGGGAVLDGVTYVTSVTHALVGIAPWEIHAGPCLMDANCLTSPNWPSHYSNGQRCEARPLYSGRIIVESFRTEAGCDVLHVDGQAYDGIHGPSGVSVTSSSKLVWSSDNSDTLPGWKICLKYGALHVLTAPASSDLRMITSRSGLGWHVRSDSFVCRTDFGVAASSQRIYIIGGRRCGSDETVDLVEEFSPASVKGERVRRFVMPARAYGVGAVVANDVWLYVVGGYAFGRDGVPRHNMTFLCNLKTVAWTTGPELQQSRAWPAAASSGHHIFVVGGSLGLDSVNSVEVHQHGASAWHRLPSTNSPRAAAGAVVVNHRLYVFGGWQLDERTGDLSTLETVESIALAQNFVDIKAWRIEDKFMQTPKAGIALAVRDSVAMLCGGWSILHGSGHRANLSRSCETWKFPKA